MRERENMSREVGRKETRKLKAQRTPMPSVWTGFGFFGLIGWSVVVPTLVGAAIGGWLDGAYPEAERNWTLALLLAGLMVGCLNAWRWVAKEHTAIRREQGETDDNK